MDYGPIIAAVVCAMFFYGAAQRDQAPAVVWAALSVLISIFAIFFTSWRVWGVLGGQVLLFVGITFFRLWRDGDASAE